MSLADTVAAACFLLGSFDYLSRADKCNCVRYRILVLFLDAETENKKCLPIFFSLNATSKELILVLLDFELFFFF